MDKIKKGFTAINSSNRWKEQRNVLKNTEFCEENERQMKKKRTKELMSSRRMQFFILLSFAFVLQQFFFLVFKRDIYFNLNFWCETQSKLNLIEINDFPRLFWECADRDGKSENSALLSIWTLNKGGTWVWLVVIRKNLFMVHFNALRSVFRSALIISYHFQLEILSVESWSINLVWRDRFKHVWGLSKWKMYSAQCKTLFRWIEKILSYPI